MNEPAANTHHNLAQLFHERDVECQRLTAENGQLRADRAEFAATLQGLEPILAAHGVTLPAETKRKMMEAQNIEQE